MKALVQDQKGRQTFGKIMFALLAATCLAGGVFHMAQAQTTPQPTPSDDQVNAVARQFYCPVCSNTPLDVCPTTQCAQWRELIRQELAAGWSTAQIKVYFVQQYGDQVLPVPPARGFNWLIYLLPPAAILVGIYILYRALRGMRRPQQGAAPAETPDAGQTDDYIARVEEDLQKRQ